MTIGSSFTQKLIRVTFVLKDVKGFEVRNSPGIANTSRGQVGDEKL